ncbi:hypothetical protein PVAP13_5KG777801 [Panicum virgatum]|uniref:Peptide chain release factor domain-containing protein n=1 Tax=Panicum virgatum TaxID=38727 RepID=A0A8T0SVB5_PANVG|nr:hypothetical protein PVAP13_5KG777801 [Panicum virgatum]
MQIPLENLRNKLMIALRIHVTRCKASQLLMASSCTSLQTLPSKSISNLIITIDTYLAPRYLRWLSKVPKRGNTASHSNWIRCFYRSLMRIPFACFVQEPYLIAKLDSAEKAWKEMSVRLADPDIVSDPSEYRKLAQSVAELDQVVTTYRQFMDCEKQIEETKAWHATVFLVPVINY